MRSAHGQACGANRDRDVRHVEHPRHWARHLPRIRELQAETGGFTEFVPLPFVHMEAPIYLRAAPAGGPHGARRPDARDRASRAAPHIRNIQTSWVKMGRGAQACLAAGANDLGGTLMNESITRAAGRFGQELPPRWMRELIEEIGVAHQRTTLYGAGAGRARGGIVASRALAEVVTGRRAASTIEGAPARALRLTPVSAARQSITLTAVPGIPAIRPGDDLARILGDALEVALLPPRQGDVLVVTHKIVSKAEGRYVSLAEVTPAARPRARGRHGQGRGAGRGDPVQSREVLRSRPGLIIAEHRSGVVLANAGVDIRTCPAAKRGARVLLLPEDPDASSAALCDALGNACAPASPSW